jgi:hypothetical protein
MTSMTINSRPSRPRTFLTGYAESTRDHDAGAKAGWTDPVDVATRRAAWARRRSERRSRHALSQKAGLAGAALMLLVMLFSFPPSTNPFERVQTPAVAEVQETPATASVDATDIGS